MVALIPVDAGSLAIPGGDPPSQLHVTLAFMSPDANGVSDEVRGQVNEVMATVAAIGTQIVAQVTGVVVMGSNEAGERATALLLESDDLAMAHAFVQDGLRQTPMSDQGDHPHFIPHLTLGYGIDPTTPEVEAKVGQSITFDQLAVVFAGDTQLHKLGEIPESMLQDEGAPPEEAPVEGAATTKPGVVVATPGGNVPIGSWRQRGEFASDTVHASVGDDDFGVDAETGEWSGVLTIEGVPSGDGRMIAPGALTWRELPLPLMIMRKNPDGGVGHAGAELCGRIEWIERREGGRIWGGGTLDLGSPEGVEAARLIGEKFLRGVSADLDDLEVELEHEPPPDITLEELMDFDPGLKIVVQGRVMGSTVTPFPAFQECQVLLGRADEAATLLPANAEENDALVASAGTPLPGTQGRTWLPYNGDEGLVASGANQEGDYPMHPPTEWFQMARLDGPTPLRITKEGRIYGHVAPWGSCHIGFVGQGRCVPVPRGDGEYRAFQNPKGFGRGVLTAEGTIVETGPLILDTVHPTLKWSANDAQAFYSHTGSTVGDVRLYDDEWGILACGAVRPDTPPEVVRAARASDVSPDWRPLRPGGPNELCALLCVNESGFITEALVASAGAGWTRPGTVKVRFAVDGETIEGMIGAPRVRQTEAMTVQHLREELDSLRAEFLEEIETLRLQVRPFRVERMRARMAAAAGRIGVEDEPEQGARERLNAALNRSRLSAGVVVVETAEPA
jgi:hypothetical protein